LPVANVPGLRPTPDRVRETLFNWLGQDLSGWRCIDAFAGTGALGLEAASRGASEVRLIEQDSALVAQLTRLQTRLQATAVRVERADGVSALKRLVAASMDLVLLDPPFDSTLLSQALPEAVRVLAPHGFVYVEAPRRWPDDELAALGLAVYRYQKAGAVHAFVLQRIKPIVSSP
jgi:16S rRNA (guanine(966)-N(2))-methyltransferase RsmD